MANKIKKELNKSFKIRVKRRFFLSSSALFGDIFFEFKDGFFPGKNWNDFILIILDWWINAVLDLSNKKNTELDFMDGPYEILIKLDDKGMCQLKFIERMANSNKTIKNISIHLDYLISEIISASELLFESISNPKTVKFMKNSKEIEDKNPLHLLKDIKENPHLHEDYERLKKSYKLLCEYHCKPINFKRS